MINEDVLFREIAGSKPTDEEAVFLSICIFRRSAPTKGWKLITERD